MILSQAALSSRWVEDETRWAYQLYREEPGRTILPILATTVSDSEIWLFLRDFKRVEGAGLQPYPHAVVIKEVLQLLSLNLPGQAPVPLAPQQNESADDLIIRGKALIVQHKYLEAYELLKRATVLAPSDFNAWYNLALALNWLKDNEQALTCNERALDLNRNDSPAWRQKAACLVI